MLGNTRKLVKTICSLSFAALLPTGMAVADSLSNPSGSSAVDPELEEQRLDALDAATNAFGVDWPTITTVGPQDFIPWTGTTIQDVSGLTRSISAFTTYDEAYAPINFPSGDHLIIRSDGKP